MRMGQWGSLDDVGAYGRGGRGGGRGSSAAGKLSAMSLTTALNQGIMPDGVSSVVTGINPFSAGGSVSIPLSSVPLSSLIAPAVPTTTPKVPSSYMREKKASGGSATVPSSGGGYVVVPGSSGGSATVPGSGSSGGSASPSTPAFNFVPTTSVPYTAAAAQVASSSITLSSSRSGAGALLRALNRGPEDLPELDEEEEDEEEDGEGEEEGSWGSALSTLANVVMPWTLLTRKSKAKRRKKKAKRLERKAIAARASGNTKKLARIQKRAAGLKARTLRRALRRADKGKKLSDAERRVLKHEASKARIKKIRASAQAGYSANPHAVQVPSSELYRQADALDATAAMSDEAVAAQMSTSDTALANTAQVEADIEESDGPLGVSWLVWGGILLGGGTIAYVLSKGAKKKAGGGYGFDPKSIGPAIKKDFKSLSKPTAEAV